MGGNFDEFVRLLESSGRKVLVTEQLIDLRHLDVPNTVFVLQLPDGSTAAGGRGGGFGERHVIKVYQYSCGMGQCTKMNEYEDEEKLESLDLPYHATAFPVTMVDGTEKLLTGVVDGELVRSYQQALA